MAGVGVGDDERPVVDRRRPLALLLAHPQAQVLLVAVGGQQRADQAGGLVGHLAERIAGQVGSRILADRALGRGRPPAEVDALDAHPLHGHRLPGRVRAEGGDALALGEQLAQPRVEGLGGLPRDDVVGGDGAALFCDLTCGIEAGDSVEARSCRSIAAWRLRHSQSCIVRVLSRTVSASLHPLRWCYMVCSAPLTSHRRFRLMSASLWLLCAHERFKSESLLATAAAGIPPTSG